MGVPTIHAAAWEPTTQPIAHSTRAPAGSRWPPPRSPPRACTPRRRRDHVAREVEPGKRGRGGGEPGAQHRERAAGHDQRAHPCAVDQRPDRQRHGHGGGREHRAGEPDLAERRVELAPDLHEQRGQHDYRCLGGRGGQHQRQQPRAPGAEPPAPSRSRLPRGAQASARAGARRGRSAARARPGRASTAAACSATAGPCLKPWPEPAAEQPQPGSPGCAGEHEVRVGGEAVVAGGRRAPAGHPARAGKRRARYSRRARRTASAPASSGPLVGVGRRGRPRRGPP